MKRLSNFKTKRNFRRPSLFVNRLVINVRIQSWHLLHVWPIPTTAIIITQYLKQNIFVLQSTHPQEMKLILVILILLAGSTRLEGANCDFNIEESYGNFHKSSLTQNYKNFKRECKKLYTIATGFKEEDGDDCLDGVRETKKFKTILNMLDCLCHLSRHQKQGLNRFIA